VRLSVGFQVTLQRQQLPVVVLDKREVDFDTLSDRRLGEMLGDPRALSGSGWPRTQGGQVVLVVGIGDVREQLRAGA